MNIDWNHPRPGHFELGHFEVQLGTLQGRPRRVQSGKTSRGGGRGDVLLMICTRALCPATRALASFMPCDACVGAYFFSPVCCFSRTSVLFWTSHVVQVRNHIARLVRTPPFQNTLCSRDRGRFPSALPFPRSRSLSPIPAFYRNRGPIHAGSRSATTVAWRRKGSTILPHGALDTHA